jgi:hypothetical protein
MAEQIEREIREYSIYNENITIEEAVTVIQNGLLNDPGYRIGMDCKHHDGFQDEMEKEGCILQMRITTHIGHKRYAPQNSHCSRRLI